MVDNDDDNDDDKARIYAIGVKFFSPILMII